MNRIPLATTGLFAAWLAHDLQELATLGDNSRMLVTRLPSSLPVPASVRDHGFTDRYVASAIATVGLVIAAAAVRGYRTQGRSAFYQSALLGFGLHGFGHIGMSLLTLDYVSGVATSPRSSSRSGCGPPRPSTKQVFQTGAAFQPRSPSPEGPSPAATSWPSS